MIVAGFGFRASAEVSSLRDALSRLGTTTPKFIATPEDKMATPVFAAFAQSINAKVIGVDAAKLSAQMTVTQSQASKAARGTGSVAEAAALSAAGPDARLIATRVVSGDGKATCALAEGEGI